jgi:hypothetical protein
VTGLLTYVAGRERILGRRVFVSDQDPALAAEQLLEHAGPDFCAQLIVALVLEDIGRHRP